mgnify:CR=1 FL=1
MYRLISKLVIYRNLKEDGILGSLSRIIRELDNCPAAGEPACDKETIISEIYAQISNLLSLAAEYGFSGNLWHNYLAFLLAMAENPFSLGCEKRGAIQGSINYFAKNDFRVLKALFEYDLAQIDERLGIDCFKLISDYQAGSEDSLRCKNTAGHNIMQLALKIAGARDENEIYEYVANFYKIYGVGLFGLNKAFRIRNMDGRPVLVPISNTQEVRLSDLVGYELQKKKLMDNTRAFVEGRRANNVLLYGDSGTGKSTAIKAILNEFYMEGLRMIEIYKHQFKDLSELIALIKNRNYRFIIYMDDLSFEEFETEYKYLKAVIEGGLEIKPDNVLIYATSNRRHIIRENWNDRTDMEYTGDLHRSDTMQEKLSLVSRFGITINFSAPLKDEYLNIVYTLARRNGIMMDEKQLYTEANKWELAHGGRSGRTAQQFVNYLLALQD